MAKPDSGAARLAGLILVVLGVAQVANPRLFTALTRRAYPRRTRLHAYLSGATATALGLGIRMPRTRVLATIAGTGYGAHLVGRTARIHRRAVARRRPTTPVIPVERLL